MTYLLIQPPPPIRNAITIKTSMHLCLGQNDLQKYSDSCFELFCPHCTRREGRSSRCWRWTTSVGPRAQLCLSTATKTEPGPRPSPSSPATMSKLNSWLGVPGTKPSTHNYMGKTWSYLPPRRRRNLGNSRLCSNPKGPSGSLSCSQIYSTHAIRNRSLYIEGILKFTSIPSSIYFKYMKLNTHGSRKCQKCLSLTFL